MTRRVRSLRAHPIARRPARAHLERVAAGPADLGDRGSAKSAAAPTMTGRDRRRWKCSSANFGFTPALLFVSWTRKRSHPSMSEGRPCRPSPGLFWSPHRSPSFSRRCSSMRSPSVLGCSSSTHEEASSSAWGVWPQAWWPVPCSVAGFLPRLQARRSRGRRTSLAGAALGGCVVCGPPRHQVGPLPRSRADVGLGGQPDRAAGFGGLRRVGDPSGPRRGGGGRSSTDRRAPGKCRRGRGSGAVTSASGPGPTGVGAPHTAARRAGADVGHLAEPAPGPR